MGRRLGGVLPGRHRADPAARPGPAAPARLGQPAEPAAADDGVSGDGGAPAVILSGAKDRPKNASGARGPLAPPTRSFAPLRMTGARPPFYPTPLTSPQSHPTPHPAPFPPAAPPAPTPARR